VTQKNTRELIQRVFSLYATLPDENTPQVIETPVYELEEEIPFKVTRESDGAFHVSGAQIERAAAMTYWDYEEAVLRFQKILETLGITKALEEAGVQVGDTVFIGNHELEWSD